MDRHSHPSGKALALRLMVTALALGLTASALTGCTGSTSGASGSSTSAASASAGGPPAGMMPPGGASGGAGMPGGSADTSSVKTKYTDVAYASKSSAEKLDIYLPNSGTGPFPVIISVHGGAFMMGDKADGQLSPMLSGLDRGYAVVGVNYRLSSEAKAPAQINDIKAAIRYLRANAAKYNLDPNKFVIWGGSAGGHLAALAGTSGGVSSLADDSLGNAGVSDKVQAVVDWFGPIDFSTMDAEFTAAGNTGAATHDAANSPESMLVGAALAGASSKVQLVNPTKYVTADDPAFFIQHGTADTKVPIQQSENFSAALEKVLGSGKVTYESLQGAEHADAAFTTTANVKKVLDWIDAQIKK